MSSGDNPRESSLIDGKEKEEESRSKWKFEGEEKVQIPW